MELSTVQIYWYHQELKGLPGLTGYLFLLLHGAGADADVDGMWSWWCGAALVVSTAGTI